MRQAVKGRLVDLDGERSNAILDCTCARQPLHDALVLAVLSLLRDGEGAELGFIRSRRARTQCAQVLGARDFGTGRRGLELLPPRRACGQ